MKKINLILTKIELEKINNFIDTYKKEGIYKQNNKYFFSQNQSNEECRISYYVLDLNTDEDFYLLAEFLNIVSNMTLLTVRKNWTKEVDDFKYINPADTHGIYLLRHCQYGITDIFDFFSKLFIALLKCHILVNGNKRFAYFFLITLLRICGFEFRSKKSKLQSDAQVYCFVYKLQNREYQDIITDYKNLNGNNSVDLNVKYIKYCSDDIVSKYSNLSIKQRQDATKQEIKEWIQNNVVFSFDKIWNDDLSSKSLNNKGKLSDEDFYQLTNDFNNYPTEVWLKDNNIWEETDQVLQILAKI
ncbi:death-on-curing family protein [Mycoplasmopsis mustelae]|uniref:Death-on-curing family protein n=1 Tax=Mycoplasmopsis mustelae TaxID=171289 RepID=A0A4R7UDL7_9BACT|nr:type II toxin-antitoxin system death-on-curing family toxin [Mycoplasmopsis mustelae]TDV24146.1 death-on-curing family protein [Mycoplasmopsis mustelae]